MHYTVGVFVAFNVILLLMGSVNGKGMRYRPSSTEGRNYELPPLPPRRGYELPPLPTPWRGYEDPDSDYDDSSSDQVNRELAKIKADLRALKSLVEGLRQKVDPDFKPEETEEPKAEPRQCPEGFEYLPEARGCYKAIAEAQEWSSAKEQCERLNASLISIESREESKDVTKYLTRRFARLSLRTRSRCYRPGQPYGYAAFWTSGQRVNMSDCRSEFVWKTNAVGEAPFSYTQWFRGEPNCWIEDEKCAELMLGQRSNWNDVMCYVNACPLCEYNLN